MSAPGPKRIDAVSALRRNQFSEDDGSGCHPVKPERYADVQNLYTATIYEKGAELIRMLYILLGDELFHRGVRLYLQRNDGLAVTTEEFMGAMEEVSDRDLSQFRLWYHQKGRPRITVEGQYFGETESYKLKIGQSLPGALPMLIPITMSLFDSEGVLIPLKLNDDLADETVLELTEAAQTFVFEGIHSRPIPSMFRGFSAPVSAEVETSDNDLSVLMAFDSDPYSQWDASQQLTTRIIRRLAAGQDDQSAGVETYIQAFGKTLNDTSLDPALLARVLTVADEPALSDGLTIIDVDGHVAGRSHLRSLLVEQYREKLLTSYHMLASTEAYVPEPDAIARRAHRNLCLELLMENPLHSIRLLCLEQLQQSDNMNDAFVALACLCNVDCPEREEALEFSLQRWKKYPIAMSQWFTAQGLSKAHDTVDRVIELTSHAEFNLDNPNLTMALYGSIFRQNRVAFHDVSGKGYEFLADTLIMGDKLRPSGSRWLMPQINQWRRFDAARQKLMRSALERVGAEPDLSPGLAENISNALG
jgi:aminopeptidase N